MLGRTTKPAGRLLLSTLVFGLLAFAAPPAGASAASSSLGSGLSGLYEFEPAALRQVHAAGVSFVRVVISWKAIAPAGQPANWNPADPADPAYSWSQTDEEVRTLVDAGFTPLALVTEAPEWAERCRASGEPGVVCNPDPEAFATFAHAAAVRYGGNFDGLPRIQYWEPFNEPNLSLFFNPQFGADGKPASPQLYRVLLNRFYGAIKAVNPSNLVLGGGLGPIEVPRYTIGPMQFTRLMLCMKGGHNPHPTKGDCEGGVHFDIFDAHPYTTGGPTHQGGPNDVELGDLGKLQELLRAARKAGRIRGPSHAVPLWITEFSWDTKPPDPGGLPMKIAARWASEAIYLSWKAGVSNFFWFSLRDQPEGPSWRETVQSGLYFAGATVAEDRPKTILYAFRFPFVAYPRKKGLAYWGRTLDARRGTVSIQVLLHGKWRQVTKARTNGHGLFNGVVHSSYGADKHGSVRAVFAGEASVPFSMQPVKDFWHPPFG